MRRQPARLVAASALLLALAGNLHAQQGATKGEWRYYGADQGNTKYSPLDQINARNVRELEIVWRWKADNFGPTPDYNWEVTPLMIGGVLYFTAGSRRDVVAVDAATGETLWMYRLDEGERGDRAPRKQNRGLAYWTDGKGDARLLLVTPGYQLVALDAKTGRPIPAFGKDGIVELTNGLDRDVVTPGQIGSSSPAVVVRDVVVVGAAMIAGTAPPSKTHVPGYVRGFDVRTGQQIWTFKTIPQPGEFGHETWEGDSWKYTGNTAAWAPLAADEELGYVYVPVETPTGDFYGGHRLGDNLFGDSLVCLDAKTGRRVWHFQIVHHDIWDWEPSSPPMLADITVGGKKIKAVAQVTKQAFTFVFDRVTGMPVWPIEERPVPQTDVPGERTSPTQPFPTRPAPFDRQGVTTDDLLDFTPELKAEAIRILGHYKTSTTPYLPPSWPGPTASCRRCGCRITPAAPTGRGARSIRRRGSCTCLRSPTPTRWHSRRAIRNGRTWRTWPRSARILAPPAAPSRPPRRPLPAKAPAVPTSGPRVCRSSAHPGAGSRRSTSTRATTSG